MNGLVVGLDPRQLFLDISEHQPVDFSKALLQGCNQSTVKNSILALRRGPIRYRRNAMIVCEGDPTEYILLVVSGVARSGRTNRDGSCHIAAFHFPGELFGWSCDLAHSLFAEAVTETLILFLKRSTLLGTALRESRIANYLLTATTNELRRAQEHSLMVSRPAGCRVATFLIDLSIRMGKSKYLDLPMPYRDIADHLGLTVETLSRNITALEKSGSIARSSCRRLILRDRASLIRMAGR
jgi:CRP/FNR family nitrogen fixation transcriptional regulator